jgi:hypothetical protein
MMYIGDAACDGIVHRDHRQIGFAGLHGVKRVFKRGTGQGRNPRKDGAARQIRKSAMRALKSDGMDWFCKWCHFCFLVPYYFFVE